MIVSGLARYARWLHTQWPAGSVEPFPEVHEGGRTSVPGVYVAGDLTGVPLLKIALDTGVAAIERIASDLAERRPVPGDERVLDLAILGAGVSGLAAAVEAKRRGLSFAVLEATEPLSTLVNFPKAKPIYTYPRAMTPRGALQVSGAVKETLLAELREQIDRLVITATPGRAERIERRGDLLVVHVVGGSTMVARRVLVAVGRSGDFRKLGVQGESLDKVFNRLHDPKDFAGQDTLVVGGGDTAVETAIALAMAGARVTLACRGATLSRPKPENLEKLDRLRRDPAADVSIEHPSDERVSTATPPRTRRPSPAGRVDIRLSTRVREIGARRVVLTDGSGRDETIGNDVVFVMIGREPPLDLFRRSGLAIAGEWTRARVLAMSAFLLFCAWLYNWKSGGRMSELWTRNHWFPTNLPDLLAAAGGAIAAAARDPGTLIGTLAISAAQPSFLYTLAYSIVIVVFGVRRIRRRRTPYVTAQTVTLMLIQVVPLFLLPEIVLPLLDRHGLLPRPLADALFPVVSYGHGREFWRAYGLILAWPLNVYNLFTVKPLWAWIGIGFVQTCVLIPLGVYYFGKGAYCGWVCSCGALAETLGDDQRQKMPHGPGWNRLNLAGQVVLAIALVMLVVRIVGWVLPPGNRVDQIFFPWLMAPYKWFIDVFLAGVLGYGLYFWLSGRVWCRFFCPLAALMHVYARFSSFRILADKKKCISCGQCTTFCHQGIDVMAFANKGEPMADPQCVRCSACVHVCPTGVLSFGRVDRSGGLIGVDTLLASPVRMRERD